MRSIRSIDALEDLSRDPRVNGHGVREKIAFEIPGMARRDLLRVERALNRYQARCGCAAGAVCFLAGLGLGLVWITATEHSLFSLPMLGYAVAALLAALLLGLCGKLLAIEITRLQFAAACKACRRQLLACSEGADPRVRGEG